MWEFDETLFIRTLKDRLDQCPSARLCKVRRESPRDRRLFQNPREDNREIEIGITVADLHVCGYFPMFKI
ncbi:GM19666 [Drosophila sechellia]|uniref:GM19666 n=1 Tax=Drosophila sechellia TaxID=7238 RepID=B4IP38_DROSE|nr:GM19666 [Drosophila sechellia]